MAVVLVIGASGEIGAGLVKSCLSRGDRVIATVHWRAGIQALRELGCEAYVVDVAQPTSVSGLAWRLDGEVIHEAWYVPEIWDAATAAAPPTHAQFDHVMHTNVLGVMQVLPQVMPCIDAVGGTMVCISSAMSRWALADSSAWLYRASKAALNMVVACSQQEWKKSTVIAMDTGWSHADAQPVSNNREDSHNSDHSDNSSIYVQTCVERMLHTVQRLTPEDRGRLMGYDGERWNQW